MNVVLLFSSAQYAINVNVKFIGLLIVGYMYRWGQGTRKGFLRATPHVVMTTILMAIIES